MPGPPPKRDAERRRRNKSEVPTETVNIDELLQQEVEIPIADERWEPLTTNWYNSLRHSGQAIWYEPSDWMTAYLLAEVLDRWLKPQDVKVGQEGSDRDATGGGGNIAYIFEQKIVAMPGGTLNSILKGMSALMTTEGERRRLRIELERKKAVEAALGSDGTVVSITKNREHLFTETRNG